VVLIRTQLQIRPVR